MPQIKSVLVKLIDNKAGLDFNTLMFIPSSDVFRNIRFGIVFIF